jgi:hypothetical protein
MDSKAKFYYICDEVKGGGWLGKILLPDTSELIIYLFLWI